MLNARTAEWAFSGSRLITCAHTSVGWPATGDTGWAVISSCAYQGQSPGGNVTETSCVASRAAGPPSSGAGESEDIAPDDVCAAAKAVRSNKTRLTATATTAMAKTNRLLLIVSLLLDVKHQPSSQNTEAHRRLGTGPGRGLALTAR
ncbi:MAG TPA: hypothetical protein PKZ84_00635 [Anaerolineae bacterium]|nr:hypothetical protein [Anaerolineae bacterium]